MLINVPQYIDVEDKIVGPLTAKQLGWVIALGVVLLILWNILPAVVFFIIAVPLTLLILAMAFYRPYGQPMGSFVLFGIMYFFKPKLYIWKRTPQNAMIIPEHAKVIEKVAVDKHMTAQSLSDLARLLDSDGEVVGEDMDKILKQIIVKK